MTTGMPDASKRWPSSGAFSSTEMRKAGAAAAEQVPDGEHRAREVRLGFQPHRRVRGDREAGRRVDRLRHEILILWKGGNRSPARDDARVTVVSIAASDSGGGAGIQADLLTFAAHGVHGATVLTAATAQNTRAVTAIEPLSPRFIAKQIDAVFADLRPARVKIGMLYDAVRIRAVAAGLRHHRARKRGVGSGDGRQVRARGCCRDLRWRRFRDTLLPLADLVTPNLPEAEVLAGMRIRTAADRRIAAASIYESGPRAVLIKGGHGRGGELRDLLFDGRFFTEFVAKRIRTRATHGTGCTLSSAIAANLAMGAPLEDAIVGRSATYARGWRAGVSRGRASASGSLPRPHVVPADSPCPVGVLHRRDRLDGRCRSETSPRTGSRRTRPSGVGKLGHELRSEKRSRLELAERSPRSCRRRPPHCSFVRPS
jgi:hydroxymethylpyrimidine/phosphomethylpyrimidine kinase